MFLYENIVLWNMLSYMKVYFYKQLRIQHMQLALGVAHLPRWLAWLRRVLGDHSYSAPASATLTCRWPWVMTLWHACTHINCTWTHTDCTKHTCTCTHINSTKRICVHILTVHIHILTAHVHILTIHVLILTVPNTQFYTITVQKYKYTY